nr:hypothetical protein [Micromonospora sp. DSM 115978]
MTSPEYDIGAPRGADERHRPCEECDPGHFDDIECRARGIEAQAAYLAQVKDELVQARERFDGARAAYNASREAATPIVSDLRQQLAQVIDQLKCLIDDDAEIRLLNCAFRTVQQEIDRCGDQSGCYFTDECDFDTDARGCRPDDIESTISEFETRVAAATAAFDDLIEEPTNLTARVAAVQAEVAAIVAGMAGDPRTTDFKRLYAQALVAKQHLADVWRGFPHTNAYVDCLCRILTCMYRGHSAIALLKGRAAVRDCHREAAQERCDRLREQTVDEVMAEYVRLRANPACCPDPDEDTDDRDRPCRSDPESRHRDRQRERDRDRYGPSATTQDR